RQGAKFVAVAVSDLIRAQQHALTPTPIVCAWIGNLSDRQVGISDSSVDRLVLLPKSAFKLQPDLDRRHIRRKRINRLLRGCAHIDVDLTKDGQRNGANTIIAM